jgi:hypothetical protein
MSLIFEVVISQFWVVVFQLLTSLRVRLKVTVLISLYVARPRESAETLQGWVVFATELDVLVCFCQQRFHLGVI